MSTRSIELSDSPSGEAAHTITNGFVEAFSQEATRLGGQLSNTPIVRERIVRREIRERETHNFPATDTIFEGSQTRLTVTDFQSVQPYAPRKEFYLEEVKKDPWGGTDLRVTVMNNNHVEVIAPAASTMSWTGEARRKPRTPAEFHAGLGKTNIQQAFVHFGIDTNITKPAK